MEQAVIRTKPVQRISKIRRDYNRWVANESLEDYALRFTPHGFRKWSTFRVANTAFGAVSFLALEAIGAAITLNYGVINALAAIAAVSVVIFLTGVPIAYRAARHGLDMDLLSRGAGFGYLGSTITSLIYAGFTFIFFAIEAAIMAQALTLWFGLPLMAGYLVSALLVIPLVTHGVTMISRIQTWTQPLWLILLVLPYGLVAAKDPGLFSAFPSFQGGHLDDTAFSWAAFGSAATVAASLIAQIGEQVDFLRFMPESRPGHRLSWWVAVLMAGPGWIVPGAAKMMGGAFLAFLVLHRGQPLSDALQPTQMYLAAFREGLGNTDWAVFFTGLFVIVSQLKINVTNAYAGSLAWSNFFARLTHRHPGRVVWLVFNVLLAMLLMVLGVFDAIEQVLGMYAHLAVAWIGAVVADLVISKPLGWSPDTIEFRRAYLFDINPAGVGAMLLASLVSVMDYNGLFGDALRPASALLALVLAMIAAPLISVFTRQRYAMARPPVSFGARHRILRCIVCRNRFEADDMALCPAYSGPICSLCCTLDARCHDRCKSDARAHEQLARVLAPYQSNWFTPALAQRTGRYTLVLAGMVALFSILLWLLYAHEHLHFAHAPAWSEARLDGLFGSLFVGLFVLSAIAAWWLVLAHESRQLAQEESERQNQLLQKEIDAHRQTDTALQQAKEGAENANVAKSRFIIGMSHEMRSPLNSILGYSQVLMRHDALKASQRDAINTIHRSGEHLAGLVDGLLELSRIEAGKLRLEQEALPFSDFLLQIVHMFKPQAAARGLAFHYECDGGVPPLVHADPKRLRQIFINLLSNAIKFTETGHVRLQVRYQREIAHIDVEDTGVGIDPTDHERIFQPFERADSRAGTEGTGLGLTITRLLVELMGGDIQLRSRRGSGSCFSVRLYLPALPAATALAQWPVVGYAGERRRVLVVDDEPAHRNLLRQLLQPLGFEVDEADSGKACLAATALLPPDLVLLDIGLPDGPGWAVCQQLRQRGHGLPVVMVSANAHENSPRALQEHGSNGFVAKPIIETDLLEVIRVQLHLSWLRQDPAGSTSQALPSEEVLRELLALAAGGFFRALRARLLELGHDNPELTAWIHHLLVLLERDPHMLKERLIDALAPHAY